MLEKCMIRVFHNIEVDTSMIDQLIEHKKALAFDNIYNDIFRN